MIGSSDMPFDAYARCYDLLYRDKDYDAEAAFVDTTLQRLVPGARRLLELGCGTGAHATALAARGYAVHGVDRAAGMLERAGQRLARLPPDLARQLRFEAGDLRNLALGERFDAVVSLFHVMTYQTGDDDMAAAMATAARHLQPGGVFLFDFWYGPAVLGDPPAVRVKRVEDDHLRLTRLAEPTMHHARNEVQVDYHLFAESRPDGAIAQIHETHRLRYWFWPELARHMRAARLEPLGLWAWMSERPADASSWLAHAACRLA